MEQYRRKIEPFCLFGTESIIYTREDAAKIAGDNSYYFMVAGSIVGAIAIFSILWKPIPGYSIMYLVFNAFSYLVLAVTLKIHKSRIASVLLLIWVVCALIPRLVEFDIGGTFIFNLLLVAAAARSVKATFFFHKKVS